jgi:MFS family permease
MIRSLNGPTWLIALMPMMMMLGIAWPSLFTSHLVERLHRVKPLVLITGAFQRIPFLLAMLSLFMFGTSRPLLTLSLVALAPFLSGVTGGIGFSAWQELTANVIPKERMASVWALRSIIGSVVGIVAGMTIKLVLARYPGTTGYGILHAIVVALMMMSYGIFALIREPPRREHADTQRRPFLAYMRELPGLIRSEPQVRAFIGASACSKGIFIMLPFLGIHALDATGEPEAFLGLLVSSQMTGGLTGNFFAGWLGNRCGGKILMAISRTIYIGSCLLAIMTKSNAVFMVLFFLLGLAFELNLIGDATVRLEICPPRRRPTYLAIVSAVMLPAMLTAVAASAIVRAYFVSFTIPALLSAAMMVWSLVLLRGFKEPRNLRPAPQASA